MDTNETAFDAEHEQPASVFDQLAYEQMTQEQKFAASKEAIYKKLGLTEQPPAPTMADQANKTDNIKYFRVYEDGSVSNLGGTMRSEKASLQMIGHIRNEMYKKYGIEGAD